MNTNINQPRSGSVLPSVVVSVLLLLVQALSGGCSRSATTTTPSTTPKEYRILSVSPIALPSKEIALMLTCETQLSTDDAAAVRKQADEIWRTSLKDKVENAKMPTGIISMTQPAGNGGAGQSKERRFVYVKQADGSWQCTDDAKN